MKIIKIHLVLIIVIFSMQSIFCAQQEKHLPIICAIPGLLGDDTDCGYSDEILALFNKHTIRKTGTLSVAKKPDFGQKRCIHHLLTQIGTQWAYPDPMVEIVVATSQGTATATNAIVENHNALQQVKLLICEGYAASFNHCISHAVECYAPVTRFLPLKYYLLPYIAKCLPYFQGAMFPLWYYDPTAQQPFENVQNLPQDLPIILVHCKQDRLTPYDGVLAAYYKLVESGHANTYLISIDRETALDSGDFDDGHINNILGSVNKI